MSTKHQQLTIFLVSEDLPLVLLAVSAHYSRPPVDQDEASARHHLGQLHPPPPGQGGHVQDVHHPRHTAPLDRLQEYKVAKTIKISPELLSLRLGDSAHHHHLVLAALAELDAGVVHASHVHPVQSLPVQLKPKNAKILDKNDNWSSQLLLLCSKT